MTFLIEHFIGAAPGAQDRGFLLGDGVFDTLVAARGRPLAGPAHVDRLVAAAAAIGIPLETAEIEAALAHVAAAIGERDAIVRTSVSRGRAQRGLWPKEPPRPTVAISAQPWSRALIGQPATLCIAATPRNERSPTSRLKTLGYLDNILAAREAEAGGADDALMLNLEGRPACSTIANVFALHGTELRTPPLTEGCLDGIVRARVLAFAAGLGLRAREVPLGLDDLFSADACFLTNSVRLLRPAASLDGRPLGRSAVLGDILAGLLAELGIDAEHDPVSPDFFRFLP